MSHYYISLSLRLIWPQSDKPYAHTSLLPVDNFPLYIPVTSAQILLSASVVCLPWVAIDLVPTVNTSIHSLCESQVET